MLSFKGAEVSLKFNNRAFVVSKRGEGGAHISGGAFERRASFRAAPADFGIVTAGGDGDEVSRFLRRRDFDACLTPGSFVYWERRDFPQVDLGWFAGE